MLISLMLGGRIDAAALARISAGFAGRTLTRNVFRAALDRIDADRADGYRIVIASASYAFYVSQVARLLGTDAVATQPTPVNHDVTPKIAGENCYGEAKLAMVKDWMKAQSIAREHTYIRFYSDHASDAPCLEWADEAFAAEEEALEAGELLHRVAEAVGERDDVGVVAEIGVVGLADVDGVEATRRIHRQHPEIRVVVVYPGRIATEFGLNALGQRMGDTGRLPAEVVAALGGATQTAEEVAHVVCDAALGARGDVYTQPDAFARVRAYMDRQPG